MNPKSVAYALAAGLSAAAIAGPVLAQPRDNRQFPPPGSYQERHDDWRFEEQRWRDPCQRYRDNGQFRGSVLGAMAGAAIGSSLADRGDREEGAVLGAIVGAIAGANVGQHAAQCDRFGYYYRFDQTYPYREPSWRRGNYGRRNLNWYRRQRCRLAIAPTQWSGRSDYRYVRVCPDRMHRYRIAD